MPENKTLWMAFATLSGSRDFLCPFRAVFSFNRADVEPFAIENDVQLWWNANPRCDGIDEYIGEILHDAMGETIGHYSPDAGPRET